jgi:hypothetical protein
MHQITVKPASDCLHEDLQHHQLKDSTNQATRVQIRPLNGSLISLFDYAAGSSGSIITLTAALLPAKGISGINPPYTDDCIKYRVF